MNGENVDYTAMAADIKKIAERNKMKEVYAEIFKKLHKELPTDEARYGLLMMVLGAVIVEIQNKRGVKTRGERNRFYISLAAKFEQFCTLHLRDKDASFDPMAEVDLDPQSADTAKAT